MGPISEIPRPDPTETAIATPLARSESVIPLRESIFDRVLRKAGELGNNASVRLLTAVGVVGLGISLALNRALPAHAEGQTTPPSTLPFPGNNPKPQDTEVAGVRLVPEKSGAGNLQVNNFAGEHGVIWDAETDTLLAEKIGDHKIVINIKQTGQPTEGYGGERTPTHNWYDLRAPELILPAGSTVNGITYPDEMVEGSIKYGEATIDVSPEGTFIVTYNLGPNFEKFVNGPLPNLPTPDTAEFAQRRRNRASTELSRLVMGFIGDRTPNSDFYWLGTNFAPPKEDLRVFVEPKPLLQLV